MRSPDSTIQTTSLVALYAELTALSQHAPPIGAIPLHIAGKRCGWSTPSAARVALQHGLARQTADALLVGEALTPGEALNARLAELAEAFRDARLLRGWRNELLDVYDETGTVIGAIERAASRPLALLTKAVHLNAWTPTGELWIARRAMTKSMDPGMWDTLVGGLSGSGEDFDLALIRECDEEAGLEPGDIAHRAPLRTILRMHRRLPEGYQVEDVLVSDCVLAEEVQPANRDGEVSEIIRVSVPDVIRMVREQAFTLEAALVIIEDILRRDREAS